jgi:hypothetical protein
MSAEKDQNSASRSRDELLKEVPELEITLTLRQTLERTKRWYELHDRPIVSTDVGLYRKAFDEILMLDTLPDIDPSASVN